MRRAQIRLTLHNVSFGDTATCTTEPDPHTGRPQCVQSTNVNPYSQLYDLSATDDAAPAAQPAAANSAQRRNELRIFDVPFRDVRHSLGCFCDNTTSLYNSPLIVQSLSRTMELSFAVSALNISEDFADIYFYASYEFVSVPECQRKQRLRGAGGESSVSFPSGTPASGETDGSAVGVPITTILAGGGIGLPPLQTNAIDEELLVAGGVGGGGGGAMAGSGGYGLPAGEFGPAGGTGVPPPLLPMVPLTLTADCESAPWYVEAQHADRSLFLLTWGTFLPHRDAVSSSGGIGGAGIAAEEAMRCPTRNRLIVYAGRPLRVVRVICPTVPGPRPTALRIFSEDWLGTGASAAVRDAERQAGKQPTATGSK